MTNILKKAAAGLVQMMLTPAQVTAVRAWQPASMFEIDLHIPTVDMESWKAIKRLKCWVGDLEYRDYTPASWNAAQKLCTLYIEAGHRGAGGRWASQLKAGDQVLMGIAHAASLPKVEGKVLCIGDGSALGHFLALKTLVDSRKNPVEAGIFLRDSYILPPVLRAANPEFDFLIDTDSDSLTVLSQWCLSKDLSCYSCVYIAGNTNMAAALRKILKAQPQLSAKIYVHGFWS